MIYGGNNQAACNMADCLFYGKIMRKTQGNTVPSCKLTHMLGSVMLCMHACVKFERARAHFLLEYKSKYVKKKVTHSDSAHQDLKNPDTHTHTHAPALLLGIPSARRGEVLKHQMLCCYDSSLWILKPRLCSWLLHYGICLISLACVICCTQGGVKKCPSLLLIIWLDSCDV